MKSLTEDQLFKVMQKAMELGAIVNEAGEFTVNVETQKVEMTKDSQDIRNKMFRQWIDEV